MALYPCDSCGSRFLGKASAVYAAISPGAEATRIKLRLCPPCFQTEAEEQFSAFTVTIRDDALVPYVQLPPLCCGCGADHDLAPAFVTTYPANAGRTDYFGRLCSDCGSAVLARLAVAPPAQEPSAGPS